MPNGSGMNRSAVKPGLLRYPLRHSGATDEQLTRNADGHRLEIPVRDIQACVGDRPSDRDGAGNRLVARHAVDATADDRLGRPVLIDQRGFGACCRQKATCSVRQLLATDDKRSRPAPGIAGIHLIAEPPEMSRSDLDQAVVARLPECLAQLLDAQVIIEQVNAPACDQRREQGGDRQVERDRRVDRCSLSVRDGVRLRAPAQIVRQAQVVDHGAFGPAGRAGGVDDIGEVMKPRAAWEVHVGFPFDRLPITIEADDRRRGGGKSVEQVGLRQEDRGARIAEHEGEPLGRIGRVERYIGAPRLEDGQEPHHHGR